MHNFNIDNIYILWYYKLHYGFLWGDKMKNVLIIFGGASSEHFVSCVSASYVLDNIPREKYNVYSVGITLDGKWYLYEGKSSDLKDDKWLESGKIVKAVLSPDRADSGLIVFRDSGIEKINIDVIFPVLHGKNGEDGTIQGFLEICGIPYVGCDHLSSACSMDKAFTNTLADCAGISQAKWLSIIEEDYIKEKDEFIKKAEEYLHYPIFVKPANAGSSVGITKAADRAMLEKAMETAFKEDKKAVLEEFIDGYEVECAVLGNNEPVTMTVGQIKPANEFYDYEAKYEIDSGLYIPAHIPEEKQKEVQREAIRAYKVLGCSGLSRVDFFVTKEDSRVMFNEINTIPGFTSISMYAKLCEYSGIPYSELIDRLFVLAQERKSK